MPSGMRSEPMQRRLGMTVSDYVATLLADAHGMPEYAPSRVASRPQEEPPLKSA
ncbi:hypothetical protein GCM10025868_47180 [Angustibacter aerolatus]|uniref:Uncharacterized protein n=1 Tax=Angustibacter aerolatus TaxID=1162965 RepID=A0ABQ6JN46_9ACTN|nr:hypothetical protein GCM10025868_47180 [Angustibacter aerolatus]